MNILNSRRGFTDAQIFVKIPNIVHAEIFLIEPLLQGKSMTL